jgi:hypothetical protein
MITDSHGQPVTGFEPCARCDRFPRKGGSPVGRDNARR